MTGLLEIGLTHFLVLSSALFVLGMMTVATRRNAVAILMGVELILNSANINFVAFSHYLQNIAGQVFVFFALTVAASEVAVGLAIIIALYRSKSSINVDEFQLLKW